MSERRIVRLLSGPRREKPKPEQKPKRVRKSKWLPLLQAIPVAPGTFVPGLGMRVAHRYAQRNGMRLVTRPAEGGLMVWRLPTDVPHEYSPEKR